MDQLNNQYFLKIEGAKILLNLLLNQNIKVSLLFYTKYHE
jgi:hypothetical protein